MTGKKLELGRAAPRFTLPASGALTWKLQDQAGRNLVLYFYPRDNTPGCIQEGIEFRDLYPAFAKARTGIVGLSPDSVASHDKFIAKMQFPFLLLADTDRTVCKLFDVIREKSMYGKKYLGVERSTFLIDAKGMLRAEWRKVKVKGHAQEVLAAAQAL